MTKSVFEKIADRELPGNIVWEDDEFIAFLSIDPISEGHTLVVPKKNLGGYLFDLSDSEYGDLLGRSKIVAKLLEEKLSCERILLVVEGFEVPHVHVHLIPAYDQVGLEKMQKLKSNEEELAEVLKKIVG